MKPSRFDYYAPQSLDEALTLLEKFASDARLLAGGQSLVPLMNMRLASPQEIIDILKIAALVYVVFLWPMVRLVGLLERRLKADKAR